MKATRVYPGAAVLVTVVVLLLLGPGAPEAGATMR